MNKVAAFLWRLLFTLTGGRPMYLVSQAFRDDVSGQWVYHAIDRLGRVWFTNSPWDSFRVAPTKRDFHIGDLVGYDQTARAQGFHLVSGCEIYSQAVIISVGPLILVSEETDMRWSHFSTDAVLKLKVVGKAPPEVLLNCYLKRFKE